MVKDGLLGFKHSEEMIKIKLKFNASTGFIFYETPISSFQVIKEDKKGYITLEDKVHDTFELRNWLCGFGENVEVLSPKSLRIEIKEKLMKAVNNYEN